MADKKISQFPEKTSLDAADDFAIVDSLTGITKKITAANAKIHLNAIWDDDGLDVKTDNDPRNIDLQAGGLKDAFVTTPINLGDVSNTTFLTTNQTILGAVNEVKTDLDGFSDELKNLDAFQVQQIINMGATVIGALQWTFLGGLDQAVSTNDDVTFDAVLVSDIGLSNGIVTTTGAGLLGSTTILPNGTEAITQDVTDSSTLVATTAFVHAQGAVFNEFKELLDVTGAYSNAFALYRTNQGAIGLEETTTLLIEPAPNQFTLRRGITDVTIQADLTVEATSFINQDVTTDAAAQFTSLRLNGSGGAEKLNVFGGNIQLDNNFAIKFFNLFTEPDSPNIKCDINNNLLVASGRGNAVFDVDGAVMVGPGTAETSAALQINGTDGALLLSRMTEVQRDALIAVNGMLLYNTSIERVQKYQNDSWTGSEGTEEFKDLVDVTGAYSTPLALYRTNSTITGLEETDVTLTVVEDSHFEFARGTALLSVTGIVYLNQSLLTTTTPTFAGMTLNSVSHGLIIPRMTSAARDALQKVSGTMIYNITDQEFQGVVSATWERFAML